MKNIMITLLLSFTTIFIVIGFSFAFYMVFKLFMEIRKDNKKIKECNWISKGEILDQEYKTSCGNMFYDASESGEPVTGWLTYCPYCSNKVEIDEDRL